MSWNYRVMRHEINVPQSLKETRTEEEKHYFAIHEVYYNEAGQIYAWTKEPVTPQASNFEELLKIQVAMIGDSLNRTVLEFNMKPEGEIDDPSK